MEVEAHLTQSLREPRVDWAGRAAPSIHHAQPCMTACCEGRREGKLYNWCGNQEREFPLSPAIPPPSPSPGSVWEDSGGLRGGLGALLSEWYCVLKHRRFRLLTGHCFYSQTGGPGKSVLHLQRVNSLFGWWVLYLFHIYISIFWVGAQASFMQRLPLLCTGFCKVLHEFQHFVCFLSWWQIWLRKESSSQSSLVPDDPLLNKSLVYFS